MLHVTCYMFYVLHVTGTGCKKLTTYGMDDLVQSLIDRLDEVFTAVDCVQLNRTYCFVGQQYYHDQGSHGFSGSEMSRKRDHIPEITRLSRQDERSL